MSCDWPKTAQTHGRDATVCLPPAMVEETNWDILLARYSGARCELALAKLVSLISVTEAGLNQHLAALEQHKLITGAQDQSTGEVRAFLTPARSARPIFGRPASCWSAPITKRPWPAIPETN